MSNELRNRTDNKYCGADMRETNATKEQREQLDLMRAKAQMNIKPTMDDLISRQAVLEATSTTLKITGKENAETVYAYIKKLCDDIKALPSAQQWIPCSERLPHNERKAYWICLDTGGQCECRWTNNKYGLGESDTWGWSAMDIPMYTKVIAWMPLPEPYKEVSD